MPGRGQVVVPSLSRQQTHGLLTHLRASGKFMMLGDGACRALCHLPPHRTAPVHSTSYPFLHSPSPPTHLNHLRPASHFDPMSHCTHDCVTPTCHLLPLPCIIFPDVEAEVDPLQVDFYRTLCSGRPRDMFSTAMLH